MTIMGLPGRSGAGKMALLGAITARLAKRGTSVWTVRHGDLGFDIAISGNDLHRRRLACAAGILVASASPAGQAA